MAKSKVVNIATRVRPKAGEPGSGHIYITEHRDGQIRAACSCGRFKDSTWRFKYEDCRADFRDMHTAAVEAEEAGE